MKITAILNVHGNIPVVKDTIESIMAWMTRDILMVVDEAAWPQFEAEEWPVTLLKGFYHNYYRSPYRNIVYSLYNAYQAWPKSDWYCYIEYDALVASSSFRSDLFYAQQEGYWLIGSDLRRREERFPLVENLLGTNFSEIFSFLGAVLFYSNAFLRKGVELGFWEKFLTYTNDFRDGFFPDFTGYDLVEHMMPTLANHWGGKLGQLSAYVAYNESVGRWIGNSDKYPMRWKPDIAVEEAGKDACIIHPVKALDSPIRLLHQEKRRSARKYRFPGKIAVDS